MGGCLGGWGEGDGWVYGYLGVWGDDGWGRDGVGVWVCGGVKGWVGVWVGSACG